MNKDFPFTTEELEHLRTYLRYPQCASIEIWQRAFSFYNTHNTPKLQMSCRPCYEKVYQFLLTNLKNNVIHRS